MALRMGGVRMKVVELFSGAGGLSVGLERAGFEVVVANEIEPDFARTFSTNHPSARMVTEDIRKVPARKLLDGLGIDRPCLVSGGPPCQGFSTVGSKDRNDPRNALFREYLRVVGDLDPDYVLFENVPGFKTMYSGEIHDILLRELEALGYQTTGAVLNSSDFGLPQVRLRTIIVGWRAGLPPVHLPTPTHFAPSSLPLGGTPKVTVGDAISDLPPILSGTSSSSYLSPPLNAYQSSMRVGNPPLCEHSASSYGKTMLERFRLIPAGGSVSDLPLRLRPKSYFANTYARLHADRPAPTITRNFGTPSSSRCIHPTQDRALSTREGARLQGFPDGYIFHGSKCSKNLQIGNAVPPIFGEIIAREIVASITARASSSAPHSR
jgi:DNA (cytosine-5)-methyltransferase 1